MGFLGDGIWIVFLALYQEYNVRECMSGSRMIWELAIPAVSLRVSAQIEQNLCKTGSDYILLTWRFWSQDCEDLIFHTTMLKLPQTSLTDCTPLRRTTLPCSAAQARGRKNPYI